MAGSRNRVAVMHGANLDQLGKRDPEHYGELDLSGLERQVEAWAKQLGMAPTFFQSNHEGEFIDYLHRAPELTDALIVNAGAWTHYSWAIRDAVEFSGLPAVEVHLSDVQAREEWRRHSVFEGLVLDVVSGEKENGYKRALEILAEHMGGES
jgi:3-dehydroquinate dehydratase-2